MKSLILVLLSLLSCLSGWADEKEKAEFFARYECAKDQVIVGDSVMVNLVLYSDIPFQKVECQTKNIKTKGGYCHALPQRGERQQQRVRLEEGVYYAIVWQRFIVGSDAIETVKFPETSFEGSFIIYEQEQGYDPFDPFGFFGRRPQKSHTISGKCKTPLFTLPFVQRPKRSTQDIINSGGQVA